MTSRRYQKLTQYLHVSDKANVPAQNSADYDKLYKIHPVLNMVWHSFAESYKPGQNHTTDKSIIAFKGRLSYVQYLPAKPIKCDADTAYLHQFEVYLGWQKKLFSLELDMMWWWSYVRIYLEENHHVYFDNLFISVQLLKDLLACKTYCMGQNKKYLPQGIHKPGRMICGAYK